MSGQGRQDELPKGWVRVPIGHVLELHYGKALPADKRRPGSFRVMGSNGPIGFHDMALTQGPTLVIGRKGAVGATYLSQEPCWPIDTTYYVDSFPAGLCPEYVHRFLSSQSLALLDRSTAIPGLNRDDLSATSFPLPPLGEQRRIVARLDELFTRLDAAVEALQRVKAQLARYRQAVLKAAFEGKLTEKWRDASHREPGVDPMCVEQGRPGVPPSTASRLVQGATRPLPKGWVWTTLGDVGKVSGGITKNAAREKLPRQMPYLRVANVYANELRLGDVRVIGVEDAEVQGALLKRGDLLVVEGNGSQDQIGRVAVWDGTIAPCVHQNHIIKVRLRPEVDPRFALWWLLSASGRDHIMRVASSTSGLYTLSLSKVSSLPVPVAPFQEQIAVVAEIERRLSIAYAAEQAVDQTLRRAERLRQAILRRAFEGRLVPQDPKDEPAELLLERIRAQRAQRAAGGKRGRGGGDPSPGPSPALGRRSDRPARGRGSAPP